MYDDDHILHVYISSDFQLETSSILSILSQLNLQTNTMFHAMQCEELVPDYWKGKVRKSEESGFSALDLQDTEENPFRPSRNLTRFTSLLEDDRRSNRIQKSPIDP